MVLSICYAEPDDMIASVERQYIADRADMFPDGSNKMARTVWTTFAPVLGACQIDKRSNVLPDFVDLPKRLDRREDGRMDQV